MSRIEDADRQGQRVINDRSQAPRVGTLGQKPPQNKAWLKPEASIKRQQESVVGPGAKPCGQWNRIADQQTAQRKDGSGIERLAMKLPVGQSVAQASDLRGQNHEAGNTEKSSPANPPHTIISAQASHQTYTR